MSHIVSAHARPSDAYELQLRAEDAAEVSEAWRQAVEFSILNGEAFSFRDQDGALVALFGIDRTEHAAGIWLLSSSLIEQHKAAAWRIATRVVKHLQQQCSGLIYNYIPKRAHSNREFVQALGFVILPSPRDGFDLFFLPHA
jgi:hypothetical protein